MTSTATATVPVGKWVEMPRVRVQLDGTCPNPASPKRAKVTGSVEVVFQRSARAQVATNGAHVNDNNPGIEFKGRRFLARVNFTRNADGTWTPESSPHVSDRDSWGIGNAPQTFTDAIVEALGHELAQTWTEALDADAEHADAMRDLARADEDEAKALEAWRQAREAQGALQRRVDDAQEVRTALAGE